MILLSFFLFNVSSILRYLIQECQLLLIVKFDPSMVGAKLSLIYLNSVFNPPLDALDTGSNKSAIVSCNKLLKKHPNNELIKVYTTVLVVGLLLIHLYCPGIEGSRAGQVTKGRGILTPLRRGS